MTGQAQGESVVHEHASRAADVNLQSRPQVLEYEAISDRIADDRPGRVLDWGCGWGHVTSMLRERGIDTEAFDYRPDEAEPTRRMIDGPYPIEACVSPDPVALPYGDAEFDAVLSLGVLEHVGDPAGSLRELHRVLRPNGRLYIYKLPNRYSYLEWVAKKLGLYYHGALPDDRIYDKRSAVALVESEGFRVTAFRRTNLLPLTLPQPWLRPLAPAIWAVNRVLRFVPGLSLLATNLELDAVRQ